MGNGKHQAVQDSRVFVITAFEISPLRMTKLFISQLDSYVQWRASNIWENLEN